MRAGPIPAAGFTTKGGIYMYHEDKDVFTVPVNNRINALRDAANVIPVLCMVIKEFDGKVYNVRFDRAIKSATNQHVYVDTRYNWISIYMCPQPFSGGSVVLAQIERSDLKDGKRIPADKMIESARSHRESYLNDAYYLESNRDEMYQAREYIIQEVKRLNKYIAGILPVARDIYKIPYRVDLR